jgi:hypothetical protein
MVAAAEADEYLAMIREMVCVHCPERPAGGPPCLPLGKQCGVELHLPQLIDSIREVHSRLIAPYVENNQNKICAGCAFLHSSVCPCPVERLAVLVVEAVEAVDDDRRRRAWLDRLLSGQSPGDGSSTEGIAPAEKGGENLSDHRERSEQEEVYIVLIRNPGGSPEAFERPLVRCYSHAEAGRLRRELRKLGYESVARRVGLGATGD